MKSKKIYLDSVSQLLIGKKKDRKAFLNKLSHDIDEYLLSARTPPAQIWKKNSERLSSYCMNMPLHMTKKNCLNP